VPGQAVGGVPGPDPGRGVQGHCQDRSEHGPSELAEDAGRGPHDPARLPGHVEGRPPGPGLHGDPAPA